MKDCHLVAKKNTTQPVIYAAPKMQHFFFGSMNIKYV